MVERDHCSSSRIRQSIDHHDGVQVLFKRANLLIGSRCANGVLRRNVQRPGKRFDSGLDGDEDTVHPTFPFIGNSLENRGCGNTDQMSIRRFVVLQSVLKCGHRQHAGTSFTDQLVQLAADDFLRRLHPVGNHPGDQSRGPAAGR